MTTAYAIISGLERAGLVTVRGVGQRHHPLPFQRTQHNRATGEWVLPRQWGGGKRDEMVADFDADLASLGYRRVGEWVYDPTNRWATGYETAVEAL